MPQASFPYCKYLGGHDALGTPSVIGGNLIVTDQVAGIGTINPKKHALKLSAVTSVEVEGAQHVKSKTGRTVAFGVLGGLSGASGKDVVNITFHTKSGQAAYFQLEKKADEAKVRAKLAPVLRAAGVPFHDAVPPTPAAPVPAPSVADELAKLAALRDQGVLSDDEFAAQKAKLLG